MYPIVSTRSCTVRDHGAKRKLPFEIETTNRSKSRRSRSSDQSCFAPKARSTRVGRRRPSRRYSTPVPSATRTLSLATCWAASPQAAGNSDQNGVFCTDCLQLNVAQAKASKRLAHLGKIAAPDVDRTIDQRAADDRCRSSIRRGIKQIATIARRSPRPES